MSNIALTDTYIDSLIKVNDVNQTNPDKTEGLRLRALIKAMRDNVQGAFNPIEPDTEGVVSVNGGVELLTASQDIVLDVADRTPGLYGLLFLVQDAAGQHKVSLASLNQGLFKPVPIAGGTVTKISWENLKDFTAWTAEQVIGPDAVQRPALINDLKLNFVDSTIAQLSWTAPSGDAGKVIMADSYTVYLNNGPFTDFKNLDWLPVYDNDLIPGRPGETETLNLNNLSPSTAYHVAVVANKTIYGQSRKGAVTAAGTVDFVTQPLTGAGLSDILIPLQREQVSAYNTAYLADPVSGEPLDEGELVDYSKININEGGLSGSGNRGMKMVPTGWFKGYYNQLQAIYFDLQGIYTLNHVWLIVTDGDLDLIIDVSSDGVNWVEGGRFSSPQKNAFINVVISNPEHVRFFRLYADADGGNSAIFSASVVVATGKAESAAVDYGGKYKNATAKLSLKDRMGTNIKSIQDPVDSAKLSTFTRVHFDHSNFLPEDSIYRVPATGASTTVTLTNISYGFAGLAHIQADGSTTDFDQALQNFKAQGIEPVFCLDSGPLFAAPAGSSLDFAKVRKPMDPGVDATNSSYTADPQSYKFLAQFYGQVAARWGTGPVPPDYVFYLASGQEVKKAQGWLRYYEIGLNECDDPGRGAAAYTNPEEHAALVSACWDGHKGALGPGFGIKEVDPTAQLSIVGLSGLQLGYVQAMFRWWDLHRGAGDYPVKAVQHHIFNTSAGGRDVAGKTGIFAYPPEMGFYRDYVKTFTSWKYKQPALNNMSLWVGAYGYDEHGGSPFSPNSTLATERGLLKAIYLIRFFLISDWLHVDRMVQYAYSGNVKLNEIPAGLPDSTYDLATAGYLDGPAATAAPLAAYRYVHAFRDAVAGYVFSHACIIGGVAQTLETMVESIDPEIYCLAYQPVDATPGAKSILVIWLGAQENRSINIDVNVEVGELQVNLTDFNNLENSQATTGNPSVKTSIPNGDIRKITVTISATPTFVHTNRTGTIRLANPENIIIKPASATQISLFWRDPNLGSNRTKIFRSQQQNSAFILIYDDYIDTGSYLDEGLAENTVYYYRIQFEQNGLTSNLSAVYGEQTFKNLSIPSGLVLSARTATSVTMAWGYTPGDLAFIQGFEVLRSSSASGIYTRLALLNSSENTYRDGSLQPNTTYYYKVRAFKGLNVGGYALLNSQTVDPITYAIPALNSVETNYAGNRLTLKFNIPMADPAGHYSNFTVTETVGNSPVSHTCTAVMLDSVDNKVIKLFFGPVLAGSSNMVKVTYSGNVLKTIYNIQADSFTNHAVTNRYLDSGLLLNTMKINLCTTASPGGLPDWTDYNLTPHIGNTTLNSVVGVKDINGHDTLYKFTFVEHLPDSHLQGVVDISSNFSTYLKQADPINGQFPVNVRKVNAEPSVSGARALVFALMSVNPESIYNVVATGWEYSGYAANICYVAGSNTADIGNYNPSLNTSAFARITNLKPGMITLTANSGSSASADGYGDSKITITVYAAAAPSTNTKVSVCGFIIEECKDN